MIALEAKINGKVESPTAGKFTLLYPKSNTHNASLWLNGASLDKNAKLFCTTPHLIVSGHFRLVGRNGVPFVC